MTEPGYLIEWAREHRRTIDLRVDRGSAGCAPLTLVRRARELARSRDRDFDEIWCVFDVNAHPDVNSAIAEARDSGIQVAVSNPCFELWMVLHVENREAYVHRHEIQRRARELGLLDGKSIPESARQRLTDGYEDAKRRARQLDTRHLGVSPPGSNPSSGVWRLVDSIRGHGAHD
ncbi:MAG: RloB family protein [bacterium]|nr:RloB family protein [bacterium]